jgi:hypothetical protein
MRDDAQLTLHEDTYWYAVLAIAPQPETLEAANVGVVFGNGRTFALKYLPKLPRLCGLASSHEIQFYQTILEACADRVRRGIDLVELAGLLGPQVALREPVRLYAEPTDDLLDRIAARFLDSPEDKFKRQGEAVAAHSTELLDKALKVVLPRGVNIVERPRPNRLYGDKIERFVKEHKIPRIARALRTHSRDLLIDSISIDSRYRTRDMIVYAERVDTAFFLYSRYIRPVVRERLNRDIRLVGVIHPLPADASQPMRDMRDRTADMWRHHEAIVIDGTERDIETTLREETAWLAGG